MTLGTKSEGVLQLILDEGPQHISEIRKRFGAGGRHCANYLTKVGVFKREEQADPIFSLSSSIYRDVEEVKLRISRWRAEEREEAAKPKPKTMLDTITTGMAGLGKIKREQLRLKPSIRRRVIEQLQITDEQLSFAENACKGDTWLIAGGNALVYSAYALIIDDGSIEPKRMLMPTNCFVGHGNQSEDDK